MIAQDQAQHRRSFGRRTLRACLIVTTLLSLSGCGSGVANLLPDATKPAAGIPSGPILGYIFSPTDGTLRAMLGVRGSAQMSASIVPAGVYVAGDASASTALLEDATGSLFAFNLPQSQPVHVADALPAHAHIAFASSGRTAIAYTPGGSTITLITGLPSAPQTQRISVPAGTSLAMAIVSDAATVVIASSDAPQSIGTLSTGGQLTRLTTATAIGGISFLPSSDDLLLADSAANTLSLLRNITSGPSIQPVAAAGLNHPLAVAASQDHHWAIVANSGDAALLRVDLTTGTAATKIVCACQPSQLSALSGGATFRVNTLYTGPLWTIDMTAAAPQFLFVPAIAKGTP